MQNLFKDGETQGLYMDYYLWVLKRNPILSYFKLFLSLPLLNSAYFAILDLKR